LSQLFATIRALVADDKYVVGAPASERLDERGIMEWQAVVGLEDGSLLNEQLNAAPNSVAEVLETLPDGTQFKAVWSYLSRSGAAKLVTVHFFDE
jgi:hypothetical protein